MKSDVNRNKEEVRKLTSHDLAFGIGRKATDEELQLLFEETKDEKYYNVDEVKTFIDKNLKKQQEKANKNAASKV